MENAELVVKCPWCEEHSQMPEEFRDQIIICPRCDFKVDTRDKGVKVIEKPRGSNDRLPAARLLEKEAENHGKSYSNGDIALMLLFEDCEESEIFLADLLGRTPGAIDFALRWDEEVDAGNVGNTFVRDSWNKLRRQFRAVRKKLGKKLVDYIEQAVLKSAREKEIEAARAVQDRLEDQRRAKKNSIV